MNKTRLISDKAVRAAISIPELIPVMDQVFTGVSNGTIRVLPRNSVFHENGNIMAIMASSHPDENICGCKVAKVAMFPGPATAAAGTAQSVILLFSVDSGELQAIVSADYITVARTAAATAAATDRLARKDARVLCLLGSGTQAMAHAEAICAVRDVTEIRLWSRTSERLERACSRLRKQCPACKITGFTQTEEAVDGADIVCTVSKAREPILKGEWLAPGCHVNAIGACGPIFREIDESVLERSKVFVDSMDTAMASAGDLLIPMKNGLFTKEQILGEIGQCGREAWIGRTTDDPEAITLFESCGLSAQDVAAAKVVLDRVGNGGSFAF